ncbi:MAG: DNA repair protein RecN [Vampirovibrionales bacterium]
MPLTQLSIQSLGLFEAVQVALPVQGYHALLGETGAGKSLLLSCLQWLFGASVSPKEALRQGASQGKVEACFYIDRLLVDKVHRLCLSQGIDLEDTLTPEAGAELWLSREFSSLASRYRVNGSLVPKSLIEQLMPWLMEFQGQHSHVHLLKPQHQRSALDALGGRTLQQQLIAVERIYTQWNERRQALESWQAQRQQLEQQLHVLTMQAEELRQLNLHTPDEDTQLQQERAKLQSIEALQQVYQQVQTLLMEGYEVGEGGYAPSVREHLQQVLRQLQALQDTEPSFSQFYERLEQAMVLVEEVAHEASHQHEGLEASPQRLDEIQHRLSELKRFKRLYGPTLADVLAHHERIEQQLADWQGNEANPKTMQADVDRLAEQLASLLEALTQQRQQLATVLESRLQGYLAQLMLPHAVFEVRLEPRPQEQRFHPLGQEEVQFYFSANPGEPVKLLSKVASGGELARLLLALVVATEETITSDTGDSASTAVRSGRLFVFDELDTGTSGDVAKAIAKFYQQLGQRHQVLAITHQALVAAHCDQLVYVEKQVYQPTASADAEAIHALEETPTEAMATRTRSVVRCVSDVAERASLISSLALGHASSGEAESHANFVQLLRGLPGHSPPQ